MFCQKCGNETSDNSSYCGKCGTKVEAQQNNDNDKSNFDTGMRADEQSTISVGDTPTSFFSKHKKNFGVSLIVGLLVLVISQIYLINTSSKEENSQDQYIRANETVYSLEEWENGKVPISIMETEEFIEAMAAAGWGYYALKPEQIGDKKGWDWPQDLWISLFGKDHTNDGDLYRTVEIGRGVKAPMFEVRRWMNTGDISAVSSSSSSATSTDIEDDTFFGSNHIKKVELVKDIEGNECVVFTIEWTNNSEEPTNFPYFSKMFQGDVMCNEAYIEDIGIVEDIDIKENLKIVRKGVTLNHVLAFELYNLTEPIELEITSLYTDKKDTKAFDISAISSNTTTGSLSQNDTHIAYPGDVVYDGISLSQFLGEPKQKWIATFDRPDWEHDWFMMYEDKFAPQFYTEYPHKIYAIEGITPKTAEIDGVSLDKTRSELISILGEPSSEYYDEGYGDTWTHGYNVTYIMENYSFTVTSEDFGGNPYAVGVHSVDDIASADSYPDDLLYKGVPLHSFIGRYKENVIEVLGAPADDSWSNLSYDDISFGYDGGTGEVYYIHVCPSACEVNGVMLDKNRSGLIDILGNPVYEDWDEGGEYQRNFIQSNLFISFSFFTDDLDEVASKWIVMGLYNE